MAIIYKWTNKINGKSYIGQTKYPEKRINEHINSKDNKLFHKALRKYGVNNFTYIVLEDNLDENQLNEREMYWIQYYNTFYNGYNLTIGGNATRGYKFTDEQKRNLSKAHKGKPTWNKGKISESKIGNHYKQGYKCSDEQKKKMSESHLGQIPWNKTSIFMLDKKTNKVLKQFESLKDACQYLNKDSHSNISQCLNGKIKTAYGYKWIKKDI